jgi:hypothetical protein
VHRDSNRPCDSRQQQAHTAQVVRDTPQNKTSRCHETGPSWLDSHNCIRLKHLIGGNQGAQYLMARCSGHAPALHWRRTRLLNLRHRDRTCIFIPLIAPYSLARVRCSCWGFGRSLTLRSKSLFPRMSRLLPTSIFLRCMNTVFEQPQVGRRYARQSPSLQNHESGMTPTKMLSQDNEFEQKGATMIMLF